MPADPKWLPAGMRPATTVAALSAGHDPAAQTDCPYPGGHEDNGTGECTNCGALRDDGEKEQPTMTTADRKWLPVGMRGANEVAREEDGLWRPLEVRTVLAARDDAWRAALERQAALARDILENFNCHCNDDCRPGDCDCGGDGLGGLTGCWACQAYTALNGYGAPPVEEEDRAR